MSTSELQNATSIGKKKIFDLDSRFEYFTTLGDSVSRQNATLIGGMFSDHSTGNTVVRNYLLLKSGYIVIDTELSQTHPSRVMFGIY